MALYDSNRAGLNATACEKSQFRNKIDQWLNENKSDNWISKQLKSLGDPISAVSIGKYRKYREEYMQKELMNDPIYQAKIKKTNEILTNEVGKIKEINVINHLAETIEHCAELISLSKEDDVRVKNAQDLRYMQMSMIEAIKVYGDVVMQAQKFAKVDENPDLLRPAITVNVKDTLKDIFAELPDDKKFEMIDKLRGSM